MLKEYSGVISPNKTTVIQFYADWCGPCQMMKPVIQGVSEEMEDLDFIKINIDDHGDVAKQFEVTSIPTLMIMKDDNVIVKESGFKPKDALTKWINKHI